MWHILLQYNIFFLNRNYFKNFFNRRVPKHKTLFRGCQSTLSNCIPMAKLFLHSSSHSSIPFLYALADKILFFSVFAAIFTHVKWKSTSYFINLWTSRKIQWLFLATWICKLHFWFQNSDMKFLWICECINNSSKEKLIEAVRHIVPKVLINFLKTCPEWLSYSRFYDFQSNDDIDLSVVAKGYYEAWQNSNINY